MKKYIVINLNRLNKCILYNSGFKTLIKKELKKLGYDLNCCKIDMDYMVSYDFSCLIASFNI